MTSAECWIVEAIARDGPTGRRLPAVWVRVDVQDLQRQAVFGHQPLQGFNLFNIPCLRVFDLSPADLREVRSFCVLCDMRNTRSDTHTHTLMDMRTDLTAVPHAGLGFHFLRLIG